MAGIRRYPEAMKIHRFYIGNKAPREIQRFGESEAWLEDKTLRHQWEKVLRFRVGEVVGLFNDEKEFLYRITAFASNEIALEKLTEEIPKKSSKKVLLGWSLLKRDNNDIILQKAVELGVTHLVPLLAQRSEKTGFDAERALKIVIEATEQCGRIDIPLIDEPLTPDACIKRYSDHYELYIADQGADDVNHEAGKPVGVLIGPEGGWSEGELEEFKNLGLKHLHLNDFTLRAETAAIVAASKLV